MFKKTEELTGLEDEEDSSDDDKPKGTELANQQNLFAKARAMSDNGNNCFDEKDTSSDEDKKAAGNKLE
jgi:hypothetical protein